MPETRPGEDAWAGQRRCKGLLCVVRAAGEGSCVRGPGAAGAWSAGAWSRVTLDKQPLRAAGLSMMLAVCILLHTLQLGSTGCLGNPQCNP